jgi:spermidine synthase
MRHPVPKVALTVALVASAALAIEFQMSKVVGPYRVIPVKVSGVTGLEGAMTVSKLDGSRTGLYYDLGERAGELRPKAKRVVLLGLGGGEMLRAARRSLPTAELLGIDNDPRMVTAAVSEFNIGAFGARAELADAFVYVRHLRGVDVLMVDLFVADAMPRQMLGGAFWRDCRQALGPDGIVVVNVYPAHLVPVVLNLWAAAGLKAFEQHTPPGTGAVVFGSL